MALTHVQPHDPFFLFLLRAHARSLTDKDLEMAKTLLANPDITVEQVAARLSAAPATLYRYLPGGRGCLGVSRE
jgi:hypothetical protein